MAPGLVFPCKEMTMHGSIRDQLEVLGFKSTMPLKTPQEALVTITRPIENFRSFMWDDLAPQLESGAFEFRCF